MTATALKAIEVFESTVYNVGKDLLSENVEVFNQHSNGAIVLSPQSIQGDFAQSLDVTLGKDLVKSRNPYEQTDLTDKHFSRTVDNIVKLGMGLNPISWTNAEFNWVKQNPSLAGVKIGRAMAQQSMKSMAEFAIGSLATCLNKTNTVKREVAVGSTISHNDFIQAIAPMGDQFNSIELYVIHSMTYFELLSTTFFNAENLWDFGNFTVMRTALGHKFLITDNKGLVNTTGKEVYSLGLKKGSALVGTENDFAQATVALTGKENLAYRYQAEWTSALKIANHKYKTNDSMNGLTYAQVTNGANWDKISSDAKDETGVVIAKKQA
ncbi:TPA: major capsid protein [Haemophilus influenzae]